MICCHLQEHDELFWHMLDLRPQPPCVLVNVDAHSDMSMFDGQLGIGNFISKMVELGFVDEVVWVRDPRSIDFQDGTYNFKVGRKTHSSLDMACSLQAPFYFFQGAYLPEDRLLGPRNFLLTVVSSPDKLPVLPGKPWVLSVDFDYFACTNPGAGELEARAMHHGAAVLEGLYGKGRSIRTKQEWDVFVEIAEKTIPGITAMAARCFYPDYNAGEDEIRQKILALNRALAERSDFGKCLGLFSVSSLTSGFVKTGKHDFIAKCIDPWLGMLAEKTRRKQ